MGVGVCDLLARGWRGVGGVEEFCEFVAALLEV
jgi:hypothetical protein